MEVFVRFLELDCLGMAAGSVLLAADPTFLRRYLPDVPPVETT